MALGVGLCNNGFMHHGNHPFPSARLRLSWPPAPAVFHRREMEAQRQHGWDQAVVRGGGPWKAFWLFLSGFRFVL